MSMHQGGLDQKETLPKKLGKLWYRAAQRLMTLDVTRLMWLDAQDARLPDVNGHFSFRFLTSDDVAVYSREPFNELSVSFVDRMSYGLDLCYAALDGEVLAAYVWLALGSIEAGQNRGCQANSGVAASFDIRAAFVYGAYTRPEYRGRRLYPACLTQALTALATDGISRLWVTADWTNRSALEGCRRAGFRDVGLIGRFGWRGAMYTFAPRGAERLGIRLGRNARVSTRTPAAAVRTAVESVGSSRAMAPTEGMEIVSQ